MLINSPNKSTATAYSPVLTSSEETGSKFSHYFDLKAQINLASSSSNTKFENFRKIFSIFCGSCKYINVKIDLI